MTSTTGERSRRRQRDEDGGESDGPPQRRPRLEDDTNVEEEAPTVTRDVGFYRADGDCVLRVEDTLFKIHRYHLTCETSAFQGLFLLPAATGDIVEGSSDQYPIRLAGDTVDQVRAFFGYAYLSPFHLQYARLHTGEINSLISTAQFTHKYGLESFERWTKTAITTLCSKDRWKLLKTCAVDLYVTLLRMHSLHSLLWVKKQIRRYWVSRLRKNETSVTMAHALDIAEELQFRDLQGDLYYLQLQKLREQDAIDIPATQAAPPLPAELSVVHQLRLLTGYRSLDLSWNRLAKTPLALPALTCTEGTAAHDLHCVAVWDEQWRGAARDQFSATKPIEEDFLIRVRSFQTSLSQRLAEDPCSSMTHTIKHGFSDLIKALESSMADHFLGPEAEVVAS
ncbi:hypothetical protein C8R43DRAFT_887923 [Mycena crocata]|nr:hypothetical protein C8R43DRAFT_887923 [Mycena crocata]